MKELYVGVLMAGAVGAFTVRLMPFMIGTIGAVFVGLTASAARGCSPLTILWVVSAILLCSQLGYAIGIAADYVTARPRERVLSSLIGFFTPSRSQTRRRQPAASE